MLGGSGRSASISTLANVEMLPGRAGSSPHQLLLTSWREKFSSRRNGRQVSNGVEIGGNEVVVMAGPCSVESREQSSLSAEIDFEGWSARAPRRRLQAALALLIHSRGLGWKASNCCAKPATVQYARDQRGHGDFADRSDVALRRYFPGGRAQHAKLQPAARTGQGSQSRCC